MGVPLVADGHQLGIVVVQSYTAAVHYTKSDLDLLVFVAQHVANALVRARAIEETRERNAELAIINEIGSALAKQLDYDQIVEQVGERIAGIFATQSVSVGLYDEASDTVEWRYEIFGGVRYHTEPMHLGAGLTTPVVHEARTIRAGTSEEALRLGAVATSYADVVGTDGSWLGAPIRSGDRVAGVIVLESPRDHAFSDADERLLTIVAANMGVALENARLFDETKRLLGETDARAAELAIINEIGQALAKQLNFKAVIDLVGERIRDIFDARSMFIATYDAGAGRIDFPYFRDQGVRRTTGSLTFGPGLTSHVIRTRAPLRLANGREADALGAIEPDADPSGGHDASVERESWIGVPIFSGERVMGVLAMESTETDAYDEADERLLTTVASSMGVALENARLFDQTKRLLAETDARAKELAVVNEVQRALAEHIDMKAMYDLAGDKLCDVFGANSADIFGAQAVEIAIADPGTDQLSIVFLVEGAARQPERTIPNRGIRRHVVETGQPLLITHDMAAVVAGLEADDLAQDGPTGSAAFAPLVVAGQVRGTVSLQSPGRDHAFDDADMRLLTTITASLSVALENARLFDETKARAAELAVINEIGAALASQLDFDAIVNVVGERIRALFETKSIYIAILDPERRMFTFPYAMNEGVPTEDTGPMPLGEGLTSLVIERKAPVLFRTRDEQRRHHVVNVGPDSESWLGVPIMVGDAATGVLVLESMAQDAYSERDIDLLSTVASSMGVALENARLFDETKRLLTETVRAGRRAGADQRDRSGACGATRVRRDHRSDRRAPAHDLRRPCPRPYVAIRDGDRIDFPYWWDDGQRLQVEPSAYGDGLTSIVMRSRAPLRFGR